VDARKLVKLLYHMSITFDLYMGGARIGLDPAPGGSASIDGQSNGERGNQEEEAPGASDRNYCSLEAGILLSSSVIRKMRNNLERCVRIGSTGDHSVNIGRCVKYASRVAGCQESFQVSPPEKSTLKTIYKNSFNGYQNNYEVLFPEIVIQLYTNIFCGFVSRAVLNMI